jgi:hypothetical protein
MVTVLTRAIEIDISPFAEQEIYDLLRREGQMTPGDIASAVNEDESEVAAYLANEARLGRIDARYGRYSTWD